MIYLSISKFIQDRKEQIMQITSRHGVKSIKIFGSVARKEENKDSDIDFLVVFEEGRTLFDLIALKNELEKFFNRRVDIVTKDSIHHSIRESIQREVVEI